MAPGAKTELIGVCLDADVVIAGQFSTSGASHAILVLGQVGLLRIVLPVAAVKEVRRKLGEMLPKALPAFESFLTSIYVESSTPTSADTRRARSLAHEKDVPIMASAFASNSAILVTHNTKHFESSKDVRVVRPRTLITEARA